MKPPEAPRAEGPAPPETLRCPRCGAPHDRYQEYCLECGARLARLYPRSDSLFVREAWTRDSPLWFWLAFLALLGAALIAGAIVLAATTRDDEEASPQERRPATSVLQPATDVTTPTLGPTATLPPASPTTTTVPADGTDGGAGTTGKTGTTGTTGLDGGGGNVIAWPTTSGYTTVLASIPTSRGRAAAESKAREVIGKGLDEVGVLNSSDYSSLRSGYYVVFSGVHDTLADARAALPSVRGAGYPLAYVREITP